MKLLRVGALLGLSTVVAVETTRQITLRTMEGEGSAIWTYAMYWVLGFPLSAISSPALSRAHQALEALPGPAGYLLMLVVTFANWLLLGFVAAKWREHRRARRTTG